MILSKQILKYCDWLTSRSLQKVLLEFKELTKGVLKRC